MSRTLGVFPISANFEVNIAEAFDARTRVSEIADLISGEIPYPYNGLIVSVYADADPLNNGLYWLRDASNVTVIGSWKKIDSIETTDDVAEGTVNKYFTPSRSRESISAVGDFLQYNNVNGQLSISYTPENVANRGIAGGYVPLNLSGKINTSFLPDSVLGNLRYGGTYNGTIISANLDLFPELDGVALPTGSTYTGIYFIATSAFTKSTVDYAVGDWIVHNGSGVYVKVDNSDAIVSFNGRIGPITLVSADVTDALGFTPVNNARTITINGTAYDLTANRSWTVGDIRSDGSYSNPAWLTGFAWSKISSTPATLGGYGITNAYTKTEIDSFFGGGVAITGYNKSNWDTVYGWGNHASAGYVKGVGVNMRIPYFNATDTVTTTANLIWNTSLNALVVNNGVAGTIGSTLSGAFDGGSLQVWNGHELAVMGSNVGNSGDVATMVMKSNKGTSSTNGYVDIQGYYAGGANTTPIKFQRLGGVVMVGDITIGVDTTTLLQVNGFVSANTPAASAVGGFITQVVAGSGRFQYRTPAQVLSDIGAQAVLTNPVTGTGVSGRVAFWNGTNTQSSDAGLVWDNTNKRLGVGTNIPSADLNIVKNVGSNGSVLTKIQNTNSGGEAAFSLYNDRYYAAFEIFGSTFGSGLSDNALFTAQNGISYLGFSTLGTGNIGFRTNGFTTSTERLTIFGSTGNVNVNSITDDGTSRFRVGNSGGGQVRFDALSTAGIVTNTASGVLGTSTLAALSIPTGTGVSGQVAFWNGTNTITSDANFTWGSTGLTIGTGYNMLFGASLPSRQTASSTYPGIFVGNSNSGIYGETTSGYKGINLNSNIVRDTTNFWVHQDITRPGWMLGLNYDSLVDNFSILRSAATSGTASFNTLFTILGNGNVGIGTATPTNILSIQGSVAGASNNFGPIIRNTNATGFSELKFDSDTAFSGGQGNFVFGLGGSASGAPNQAYFYNRLAGAILFGTNNTERMRIDSSGNVGIGVNPSYKLDVAGSTRINRGGYDSYNQAIALPAAMYIDYQHSQADDYSAGISAVNSINLTGNATGGYMYGLSFIPRKTGNFSYGNMWGVVSSPYIYGSGTISNISSFLSIISFRENFTTNGVVTEAINYSAKTPGFALSLGTITNNYGLKIENMKPSAVTNGYGIYIDAQSGWALYSNGGKSYHLGNFLIGSNVDDGTNKLQVTGDSKFNGNVGIGTTTAISSRLVVNGRITVGEGATGGDILGIAGSGFTGGFQMWKDSSASKFANIGMSVPGQSVTNDLIFSNGSPWLERMRLTNSGNLGVNISLPLNKIHVYTTTSADGISVDGTDNPAFISRANGVVKGYWTTATSATSFFSDALTNDMIFRTETVGSRILFGVGSGVSTMRVSSSGTSIVVNNGLAINDVTSYNTSNSNRSILFFRTATGTESSPTNVFSGNAIGEFVGSGYAGGAFRNATAMNFYVGTGTISATSLPAFINFETTPDGSITRVERMRITQNGNLLIGSTTDDGTNKLQVTGGVKFASLASAGNRITYTNSSGILGMMVIGSGLNFDGTTLTATGAGVTSVSGTGSVSGLTLSGTVSTSGNLTLGGTLSLTAANVNAVGAITNSTSGNAATATSATYATNSTRLYASDGSYVYGGVAPYYMYMTYDGSRWLLQVSPASPAAVRVSYADVAGSLSSMNISQFTNNSGYITGYTETDTLQSVTNRGASTTNAVTVGELYNNGYFRNNSNLYGLYSQPNDVHFYASGTGQWNIATSNGSWTQLALRVAGHQSTVRGYLYADSSNNVGLLTNDGNWALKINSSKDAIVTGGIYPSGQTSYYLYNANSGLWTNGNLGASGDLYLGTRGQWLSSWLNQSLLTTASPTFNDVYITQNYGSSIVGVYSSTRFQGVYSMGAAYRLATDGTTPGNLYGLAWSYPSAGGQAGWLDSHGLLVMINGLTGSSLSNNIWARGTITANGSAYANGNRLVENAGTWGISITGNAGYASSAGNADTVDGYHASNFIGYNGTSYYQAATWIQIAGATGLYAPSSGAGTHWNPNTVSSYTGWMMSGSKGSYGGIYDEYSGVNIGMFDSSGNGGVYRQANGLWMWYYHLGNGSMGIGTSTTSASYKLYVDGAIYSTGNIVAYSDARKKRNIVTIDSPLEKINRMRGVYYNKVDHEKRETGVIAQEINQVLPEVVTYASDRDEYGVAYGNIAGILIEAIKEQQKQISELKLQIKYLTGSN